jgi:hypothetical protein
MQINSLRVLILILGSAGGLMPALISAQEKLPENARSQAQLKADVETVDFGEVFAGEKPSRTLRLSNTGKRDLEIRKIDFTCGCALSRITLPTGVKVLGKQDPKEPVCVLKPDESADLEIVYSTAGLKGKVIRHIQILSSDPSMEVLNLSMEIVVKKPYLVDPFMLDFGKIEKGDSVTRSLVIRSEGVGAFSIREVLNLPEYIQYEMEEARDQGVPAYRLIFHLKGKVPAGDRRYPVKLKLENDKVREAEFYIRECVLSPISLELRPHDRSGILDLGKIKKSEGAAGQIIITNKDPGIPLEITKHQILCKHSKFIEIGVKMLQRGESYQIDLTVQPGVPVRHLQGTLVLFSDHPDLKRKRIRFMAWIDEE